MPHAAAEIQQRLRNNVCEVAFEGGHLHVLVWACEHGCPREEDVGDTYDYCCALAAWGGHLEVPRWARGHGFDWDHWNTLCALR